MTKRILFSFFFIIVPFLYAQEDNSRANSRESLISAAKELMAEAKYCALITLDSTGQPQARMMEPFPPEEDLVVWFGTNPKSRKIYEINNDPRVTLYYADPEASGYVVLKGKAILVNDQAEKNKRWFEHWDQFYPDRSDSYLLIKVVPESMDILDLKNGISGDKITWQVPTLHF